MSITVIPTEYMELTEGERRLLNKIKRLYENIDRECYLYVQPRLRNFNPDYILIDHLKWELQEHRKDYISMQKIIIMIVLQQN